MTSSERSGVFLGTTCLARGGIPTAPLQGQQLPPGLDVLAVPSPV